MFALLIPTHDRPGFLRRVLGYYASVSPDFPIHVIDSSPPESADLNAGTVRRFEGRIPVRYHQFPPTIEFYQKVNRVMETLDVSLVGFCADDDFLPPQGIAACSAFLAANPEYSTAHGHAARMRYLTQGGAPGEAPVEVGPYPQRSIEADSPLERLVDHFSTYTTTFYSMQRREMLIENLDRAYSRGQDGRFGELIMSGLGVVRGKVKKLNTLYMIRESHALANSAVIAGMRQVLRAGDFDQRYALFRGVIADSLAEDAGVGKDEAGDVVDRAFAAYRDRIRAGESPASAADRVRRFWKGACRILRLGEVGRNRALELEEARILNLASLTDVDSPYHSAFMPAYRCFLESFSDPAA